MNLYLRLIRLIFKSFGSPKISSLSTGKLRFRVWPHDLDVNGHLTNARYLAFMDLGRTFFTVQTGFFKQIIKNRWFPVANAVEITFIREIKPLATFDLHTRLIFWDEKYWYFEQRFLVDGRLHALAHVRGVFIEKGKIVLPQRLLNAVEPGLQSPEPSAVINDWKNLLDKKKQANSGQ